MSPCFVLGRENVPCVTEAVNRSLKADCTDFKFDKLGSTYESNMKNAVLVPHLIIIGLVRQQHDV